MAISPQEHARRCDLANRLEGKPEPTVTIPKAEYDKLKSLEQRRAPRCTCWDVMPEFRCPVHEAQWRPERMHL